MDTGCDQGLPALQGTATLLARPNAPLSLVSDASDHVVGATLQQLVNKEWQPLAFFSRKLSTAEKKYGTYDRELLAIYLAVKHFLHMIEGRVFTIYTDHKPLTFAFLGGVVVKALAW
ncbi:hypothetical protein M8J77_007226 [Diaphorina citri]|nr:hypothetical protein M8J77_024593 [Diaphorina citri]KAI5742442.1 hypothetical protein M8J77_007226 [Diaphorina citri]